jgi:putative MATE family efflux protein
MLSSPTAFHGTYRPVYSAHATAFTGNLQMLGSMGEVQLSASSLANNFIDIFHVLNMGIGGGAGVLIAQYWGQKEKESVKKVIAIMFRICFFAAILFTVLTALIPNQIMSLYSPDSDVIEKGKLYLLWSLPTFMLQGFTLVMTLSLRSMRKVKIPFIASIISFFVNIFFNWVFIFGNLGMPRLEIAGAALGTVIARLVEVTVIGIYYFHTDKELCMRLSDLIKPSNDLLPLFAKFGVPVIISDMLLTLGNNVLSIIMGHIGTVFVAAYAIVAPAMRLCNVATMGLAQASATVTGNTVGGKSINEAQTCGITRFYLSIATGILSGLVLIIIGPIVINFYKVEVNTKIIANQLMDSIALMVVFQAIQSVLTKGVLRGGGDTRFCMVADVLFLWILSIPLGAVCGLVWKLSPFLTYLSLRSDFIVKSVLCAERLFSGKWIKKVNRVTA